MLAKNLLVDKIQVLPDSMFLYCKSWIKYHKWNLHEYFSSGIKLQTVFQVWYLFHPWNIVKFNPWKFIDWKFTNDISWMFIHNMEYNLLGYFGKFIVHVSQVQFAKSQTQIEFTVLLNCKVHTFLILKWMLPNPPVGMVPSGWFCDITGSLVIYSGFEIISELSAWSCLLFHLCKIKYPSFNSTFTQPAPTPIPWYKKYQSFLGSFSTL